MPSGTENTFLIAAMGEFVIGMLGNGFIVLVNCINWVKSKKLSSTDYILASVALSRITLLWITLTESFLMVLRPHIYASEKLATLTGILWSLSNHLATWFATCLSIFYFFKIANFSHPCFVWLRWRIGKVLLVLPLGSLFLLFLQLGLIESFNGFWIKVYNTHERNSTWSSGARETLYLNSFVTSNFIYLIPLLLSLSSLLLLFLSLMRHTRNARINSSSKDFSTEAHKRAMKMVLSFLLLSILHFFSIVLTGWCFLIVGTKQASLAVMLTWTIFPSGHSFILILGSSKLRQTALGLLWHFKCHLKRVKPLAA
ncbi:PREDICTED: taste receptor type 2 member 42-like [Miniopterus natalensis]|uniref:taste receptor type 2 member 42-like n=1 Tax=Miniopterus natalensis TaxID=291302 RepID=UPI0007A6C13F|nr:PREDICTED: taste receptor type 2 member 42-like [Miniopterus natalensis]